MTPSAFDAAFHALTGHVPMAWQKRLFIEHFAQARLPDALDIPTGLGKTSVMALWYLARQAGAPVPRRLVYVVDRRSVVDQATEAALALQKADAALRISTLRGQHIDTREWLETPSASAIIVGTVDMIGSRLLFSGYGVRQTMRPYHAGLLGCDALVVLDEAHLVPPFEQLLADIHGGTDRFGPQEAVGGALVPRFHLLSLSATGRQRPGPVFRLSEADLDAEAKRRLGAQKRLIVEPTVKAPDLVAVMLERAWQLAADRHHVIVFCNSRKVAAGIHEGLLEKLGVDSSDNIEMIVGARRVFEREALAESQIFRRFAPKTSKSARAEAEGQPGFLVCTSAGEVGVDLDAEHMVCDLVAWERMVQRLGRVNRLGSCSGHQALIDVFPAAFDKDKEAEDDIGGARLNALRAPFESPAWRVGEDGRRDASNGALRRLHQDTDFRVLTERATTVPPLRPGLTRPLLDAWAMTSFDEHPGRPEITPWLRGWIENPAPNTSVVWRTFLPTRLHGVEASDREIAGFFDAAPPHTSEMLETETWRVVDWLIKRARARVNPQQAGPTEEAAGVEAPADLAWAEPVSAVGDAPLPETPVAFILTADGKPKPRAPLTVRDLRTLKGRAKDDLEADLQGNILVVDQRIRGLAANGLLNERDVAMPRTADGGHWMLSSRKLVDTGFQISCRSTTDGTPPALGTTFNFVTSQGDEDEPREWLEILTRSTEASRATARNDQLLVAHVEAVVRRAERIATDLDLPGDYREALLLAARLHDEGKRARRWQRGFSAPENAIYGKTKGPVRNAVLIGYRHEFGSLPAAACEAERSGLPQPLQDLVLHLVAAHHGRARPVIDADGCEDAPGSLLAERTRAVALRFARLQQRWGPWGLAWWESLLRAADQQASRENDPDTAPSDQGAH